MSAAEPVSEASSAERANEQTVERVAQYLRDVSYIPIFGCSAPLCEGKVKEKKKKRKRERSSAKEKKN